MATFHQPGIAEEVAGKIVQHSVGTQSSRKNQSHTVSIPYYQEDESMFRDSIENLGRSRSAEKHVCFMVAREAREGPNTQDQAHAARQGHPFEDVMATCHPPGNAGEAAGVTSNSFGRNTV